MSGVVPIWSLWFLVSLALILMLALLPCYRHPTEP